MPYGLVVVYRVLAEHADFIFGIEEYKEYILLP
jgi:hypothetical protein